MIKSDKINAQASRTDSSAIGHEPLLSPNLNFFENGGRIVRKVNITNHTLVGETAMF